ncbi:hypothetical protein EVAR_70754_1 [Eumeta japonica]|uniref:Uncharacterized protein n=1 Tax=Eumeta variegata TaxID=151549 RepID=A0A4C1SEJ7_EUMVA|nr:hypothetical protein EVAR_70754_1 [Eumeta japonica]
MVKQALSRTRGHPDYREEGSRPEGYDPRGALMPHKRGRLAKALPALSHWNNSGRRVCLMEHFRSSLPFSNPKVTNSRRPFAPYVCAYFPIGMHIHECKAHINHEDPAVLLNDNLVAGGRPGRRMASYFIPRRSRGRSVVKGIIFESEGGRFDLDNGEMNRCVLNLNQFTQFLASNGTLSRQFRTLTSRRGTRKRSSGHRNRSERGGSGAAARPAPRPRGHILISPRRKHRH